MSFIWIDNASKIPRVEEYTSHRSVDSKRIERTSAINPIGSELKSKLAGESGRQAYQQATAGTKVGTEALFAKDIMTSPVLTIINTASVETALNFFNTHRFRHVPVVDSEGTLFGITSDRMILKQLHEESNKYRTTDEVFNRPISSFIRSRILTAEPDTRVRAIASVMLDAKVGAMPILDKAGHITGIITRSDILRALTQRSPMELVV